MWLLGDMCTFFVLLSAPWSWPFRMPGLCTKCIRHHYLPENRSFVALWQAFFLFWPQGGARLPMFQLFVVLDLWFYSKLLVLFFCHGHLITWDKMFFEFAELEFGWKSEIQLSKFKKPFVSSYQMSVTEEEYNLESLSDGFVFLVCPPRQESSGGHERQRCGAARKAFWGEEGPRPASTVRLNSDKVDCHSDFRNYFY